MYLCGELCLGLGRSLGCLEACPPPLFPSPFVIAVPPPQTLICDGHLAWGLGSSN